MDDELRGTATYFIVKDRSGSLEINKCFFDVRKTFQTGRFFML
jgi:hypothetical protein